VVSGEKQMDTPKKEKLNIILDANFFFIPSQFRVDIFEELANLLKQRFEAVLLSSTKTELEGLAKSNPQIGKQAMLGLKLAEKCKFVCVDKTPTETFDDVIVRVASEWKWPVATNDKELKKRLRKNGVATIFLRQKRRLAMEGTV
jgi:rRNA-processing protein FCF1